jgi:transcriptional regulator with XRE-family HTH domain
MGLFFDHDWFDERLKAAGLTRTSIAQAAGMSVDEVEMVFRDQRELEGPEVHAIARILAADPREVANRSGAADPGAMSATPMRPLRSISAEPEFVVTRDVITGIHERLDRLERLIELAISKIDRR